MTRFAFPRCIAKKTGN